MKHLYLWLALLGSLLASGAQAQNWRPFRPNGDVHAFQGASADTVLTLRLDSAGVSGPDSVYYFNRIMRRSGSFAWQKARNNQFGQQMRYNAATRTYTLFWNGGPSTGLSLDYSLVLKPFARVGDTWPSAFTDFSVPTTLVARGTASIDGATDSVATFRLGAAPGVTVVLSKRFGLVSAPADLRFGVPGAKLLTLARRPAPAGLSYYNPLTLLDLQPGDELGYEYSAIMFQTSPCYEGWLLRRVVSRQLTADSIEYVFQEQERRVTYGMPGCGGSSNTLSGVRRTRAAASRRTGLYKVSPGAPALPVFNDLLSYEYRTIFSAGLSSTVVMGHPVLPRQANGSCGGAASLRQEKLYSRLVAGVTRFEPGLDAAGWNQWLAEGVGAVMQYEHRLTYTRRTVNGAVQTCGSGATFATLLPTKTARAAAAFQLYPNPTTNAATLLLAAPARAAAAIRVFDAVGRVVHHQPLDAGQAKATLELRGLAAGLYVVEVQAAGEQPQQLRLQLIR